LEIASSMRPFLALVIISIACASVHADDLPAGISESIAYRPAGAASSAGHGRVTSLLDNANLC
jgi:hypothetical protein